MKSLVQIALVLTCSWWAMWTAAASDYVVVVSDSAWADPEWRKVAETLRQKHQGLILRYTNDVAGAGPTLKTHSPTHVCFVSPPKHVSRAFVGKVHQLTRALDADPFVDCLWGILTGYDSTNALRIAEESGPLVIRKVLSGTPLPLERFDEGVCFSELKAGQIIRKKRNHPPVEETGPHDSTQGLVDSLNRFRPDLFVTSGHATERDWQIGYRYRNGYFRCAEGRLYGQDMAGQRYPIFSPNPKVYLPIGNCLMGHIDGLDAMALAFLNSAGVQQMIGYTVNTWYGYAGWGCLDYFVEQPGRFTLAQAVAANDAALIYRLQKYFPELIAQSLDLDRPSRPKLELSEAAREAGLSAQDGFGLLYDRDALAFYGDPAWEVRVAPTQSAWDQELTEGQGIWTFEIKPNLGEKSFSTQDSNGSQRGARPFFHFFPRRISKARIVEGADLEPVITDDFILVPNPGKCDPARPYRVVFQINPK